MAEHLQFETVQGQPIQARRDGSPSRRGAAQPVVGAPDLSPSHLVDHLKVLYKRRRAATTAFLLVFVSVAVYTFTATPRYEARVQVLIDAERRNVVSFQEVIDQEKATSEFYRTQYQMLQSRSLARRTLDKLEMWDEFDPAASQPTGPRALAGTPLALLSGWWRARPAEEQAVDETQSQARTIDAFLANLTVSPVRDSRLVNLEFIWPKPKVAAQVVNTLAKAYIDQDREFKHTASREASDWLGEQMKEQRKRVESSESALQQYREQNGAVSLEERQNIVVQKLADLNGAVTRAKTERLQKEAAYQQIVAIQHDRSGLDTVPAILSNQFVQQQKMQLADLQRQQAQLSEKLGPNHPDMVRIRLAIQTAETRVQGEIAKAVQAMKNEYRVALTQEQNLVRALEQQKQDALELNRQAIGYGTLQRDAASNRQVFDALMQRMKETGISADLKSNDIRIVDAAEVPRKPASPNVPANLLLGLFAGLVVAVGQAFFFEYMDDRIKSPAELKGHLGLPFLGMLPGMAETEGSPLLNRGVPANFAESMRTIRTNLLFSSTAEGGQSLVVTSSGPGEGKTLVASNLAMALAQTGQKVILIDADMRRPRVHEVFGGPQEPGLSNVLVGEAKASEAVRQIEPGGLWVLPAGHIPPNPAELLGSKRFQDFIRTLAEHFAWVVIDSPPVMAVADAPVVAHIADGVLFVVGAEMTGRRIAQTAIEQLVTADARLVGAVLNRVDLERNAYYYSQYYRREYGHYYVKSA